MIAESGGGAGAGGSEDEEEEDALGLAKRMRGAPVNSGSSDCSSNSTICFSSVKPPTCFEPL